jgi:hypothetical protein
VPLYHVHVVILLLALVVCNLGRKTTIGLKQIRRFNGTSFSVIVWRSIRAVQFWLNWWVQVAVAVGNDWSGIRW